MSFKKYVISMVVCAVTIFVMIGSAFIPIKSYASISYEQELYNYCSSIGVGQGIPYLPSYFMDFNGWNNCIKGYNTFVDSINTLNYPNKIYVTYINSNSGASLDVYFYDYVRSYQGTGGYVSFNKYAYCSYSWSMDNNGLRTVNFGYNLSPSGNSKFNYSFASNPIQYYIQFSGPGLTTDNSQQGFLNDGLAKIKAFGSWLLGGLEDVGNLIVDGDYGKFWNELQENNKRYLKNTLNTSDDDIIEDVYRNFLNGDLGSVLLGDGSHLSSEQITAISNTLNKMQEVYNNNVSVRYDNDTNNYYVTPSTAYNNYTSKQITDYYNNYIAYNYNNTYNNYTVVDFSTTNSLLGEINANIINCHMALNSINTNLNSSFTTSINNIFATFEVDLKSIFDDFIFKLDTTINTGSSSDIDLTSVTDILTNINAEIKNDFNALSGIISGAIGVAWADIKADLQLIIDGINFNFKLGDIIVGDSTSSDDDTSNNIKVKGLDHIFDDLKNSFDNSIGDLNLNFKKLFDDLNLNLDNLFDDIHITIDKDNTKDNPDTPIEDDNFLIQVKNILVRKIPLYRQCLNFLEPVTNISYNSVADTNRVLLTDTSSTNSSISTTSIEDGQLDLDTKYDTFIFNNLAIITTDVSGNVVSFSVVFDTVNFMGVELNKFTFNLSPYKEKYKTIVSDILLTSVYILFAWNTIRRIPTIFGHSKEE